ncbi:MAG: ACT domain-containing protein [Eubacteriales bacterium]|nr:ACT domain-containing protein [Eubacteriales bacterium]
MQLEALGQAFSVCQVEDYSLVDLEDAYCFIGKTEEERSLVCPTAALPPNVIRRDDGWRAVRIQGVLAFSLVGVLAKIATILADHGISIFAISTYDTDYILIKQENYQRALEALGANGYPIVAR